jgi:hypothetical protein
MWSYVFQVNISHQYNHTDRVHVCYISAKSLELLKLFDSLFLYVVYNETYMKYVEI